MKRFEEINGSKFERLSHAEMETVKGGDFCISCMKRERKVKIGSDENGTYSHSRPEIVDINV